MNSTLAELPERCGVLVTGAGPAGSAAATVLARAGLDVVLVDQRSFPRDKTCGDGLIPDAHAALARLGVLDEVMARAQRATHVACIGPRGGRIDVPGRLAVLPRRELDDIVCRGAVRAGARMFAPVQFDAPLTDTAGRVCGATLSHDGHTRELFADWVVLATGAVPQALMAAGMCERQTPTGVALRGYVKNDAMVGRIKALEVVWHRKLRPGYGWIFPCPDGVFNIGAGVVGSHMRAGDGHHVMQNVNLKQVFDRFCEHYAPARELIDGGQMLGGLKGAPLRFTLEGARFSRPGLLVTGEAAGSTYSFTGEGIGKALETGMLAAQALVQGMAPERAQDDTTVRQGYEAALRALKPRFELYERANRVNAHPWLMDLLIWRARRSERLLKRMSGVLDETSNPGQLVSVKGLTRLFME
ncbi:MAG: FAD-dependent monooxygenase [Rhizobacter sp.]|nr:FAD-dependent monooxygenase [Rhizobacter sp.]